MTDDTARRERAEKWHERTPTNYGSYETRINAYLCGALEEAEIWSERFDRLQHENDALCGCVQSKHMDIEQKDAEIAALREYVRWRETGGERRMEPLPTEAISAFGRALEEKP